MMRPMLVAVAMALALPAFAQSDAPRVGGAAFSGFKTYWADRRAGCRPMVSFAVRNDSSEKVGPIDIQMEVLDKDKGAVFAGGAATVASAGLLPGQSAEIAIGGDHDITPRDCRGDMHQSPLSAIHFTVRLTAKIGQDQAGVEILRDEPMTQQRIPAPD
jgi:hypothetical protein